MQAQSTSSWASVSAVEAWSVASALEVLGHHFLAHPNGPGQRVLRLAAAQDYDDYALAVLAWGQVVKEHLSTQSPGQSVDPDGALFVWDPVAEAERTIRETKDDHEANARADRLCELVDGIEERHPEEQTVLSEIDRIHGDRLADAEDRVLHIAAEVLRDAHQWPLFARIFRTVMEGSVYEPGDEVDHYYRRPLGSTTRIEKRAARLRAANRQIHENHAA